jgi:hypothetical protein
MTANRLAPLVHYVIWKCDPSELGAVKLNKILWFSDLEFYRRTGRSITGAASYVKQQFGPVAKGIPSALKALEEKRIIVKSSENYYGRPKTMYVALTRPDLSPFTADEIAVVDMIADAVCNKHTAVSISRLTHDPLWEETAIGDDMSVAAASIIPGEATAEDVDWARKVLSE